MAMKRTVSAMVLAASLFAPAMSYAKVQGEGGPIADVTLIRKAIESERRAADAAGGACKAPANASARTCGDRGATGKGQRAAG
ncbi:hypothetical protein WT60_17140 [Burkholderia sp. MSMB617WGS]|uniref:DUF4148 domain-containing protein n=1 Tax=Burkholderia savannae TaxID=1637837 RepID=A0ABR5THQ8_9BURK|nr:hypothetical protein WS78_16995 [Burkholderia savannae]AOK48390.1 hypothetical protein WT60_17140 [Burkholderia sp. MSMB617WGS]KVG38798.1 hypothetical protein WS77_01485 [Burkholderia sp. MSMB0265]KVG82117.1 hypothetical protein WS81_10565 [Burkholderia sp. MSMB2040]KVG91410.1 hypothetical protein WS82_14920 [Burkholderia sp. MSMB2041]KVG98281.1 hypothetical protein WS83_29505 [Burkholderia sp. MSMB2042]